MIANHSWRRIAAEESFYIPEVAQAQHVSRAYGIISICGVSSGASPDSRMYQKLIDVDGERLRCMDADGSV